MDIIKLANDLNKQADSKKSADLKALAERVQKEVIEPICKEFDIAFIVHPKYDEATFVSKEDKPKDEFYEGVWYRPSWGGATSTMDNAKDQKMREAIKACWELIGKYGLISSRKNLVQSFENGISKKLKGRVEYRLGYLACCP